MNQDAMSSMPSASESSNLLPPESNAENQSSMVTSQRKTIRSRQLKHICLPSKAAVYTILSAMVVGCMYSTLLGTTVAFIYSTTNSTNLRTPVYFSLPYALLALVMVLYPLSGFLADVCCGRFKIVRISLCLMLPFLIFVCCIEIMGLTKIHSIRFYNHSELFHSPIGAFVIILSLIALTFFILGLAGYQANFIQFGLDQLMEVPSHYLGLFIHYAVWAFHLGSISLLLFPVFWCTDFKIRYTIQDLLYFLPIIMLLLTSILLIINCKQKHWFYTETGQKNPYKTILKVINFARKHNYPLHRSAFTYSDNYIPSRFDFAKERYGGPFTTEQVENVKTFLRIVLVLLSTGPVFMLEVPASYFVFPLISFHILHYMGTTPCIGKHAFETLVIGSGSLMHLLSTLILFPVYILTTFSSLRTKLFKLFTRIQIGIIFCLLGIASLLIIDIVGHSLKQTGFNQTQSQCMFQFHKVHDVNFTLVYPALNMHWSVLIPPNLFLGIGPLLVITTILEFISAQSPQSMKGFLIGVFFAIRGLFHFFNSIIITPFSLKHPWASGEMLENSPVTNCGFVYLLFTCVVGGIGFILFSVAAKKYKYRRRDEGMFCQQEVEEIYDRYLQVPINH